MDCVPQINGYFKGAISRDSHGFPHQSKFSVSIKQSYNFQDLSQRSFMADRVIPDANIGELSTICSRQVRSRCESSSPSLAWDSSLQGTKKYVTLKPRDYYNSNGIDDFLNEMISRNILYNCSSDIATVYCKLFGIKN